MTLHVRRHPDSTAQGEESLVELWDRREVVAHEQQQYGGVKVGAAFFGWLTATGMAVLLTGLLAVAGVAISVAMGTDVSEAADRLGAEPNTIGLAGAIALLAIFFIAYYCGGYVAARMARFSGPQQGFAVWVWAVIIVVVVAALAAVGAGQYNLLRGLNNFPDIPTDDGGLVTTTGVTAAVAIALSSLVGAVLGGSAGMRYHRKIDRASLE